VHLSSLEINEFRNYSSLALKFAPQGALLRGSNGSGKTNVLEAIHVLCLGRSQRQASRTHLIQRGASACHLRGCFVPADGALTLDAAIGFGRDGTVRMSSNGMRVATMREWFSHGAVVSFGPDDLGLVKGEPGVRRRFIDMLIAQIDAAYLDHLVAYGRVILNRNRLLGESSVDEALLDVYDEQLAHHGGYLYAKRVEVMSLCQELFGPVYGQIACDTEQAQVAYRPSIAPEKVGMSSWQEVFYNVLKIKRKEDFARGYTTAGPHRDTLLFFINGHQARWYGSQGQCRSLALALRLSSVGCLEQYKREPMLFLVDDAFSELDDVRAAQVYSLIQSKGQVFLTTPSQQLPFAVSMPQYRIEQGTIVSL
jgi:DNA replication and repair protein RecF